MSRWKKRRGGRIGREKGARTSSVSTWSRCGKKMKPRNAKVRRISTKIRVLYPIGDDAKAFSRRSKIARD